MNNINKEIKEAFMLESVCLSNIDKICKNDLAEEEVLKLFLEFISSTHIQNFSSKIYNELLNFLSNKCEQLSFDSIKIVVDNLMKIISNSNTTNFRSVEILPSFIQLIDHHCLNQPLLATYSRKDIFAKLISTSWNNGAIIPLISCLKEINLLISEVEDIVHKVIQKLEDVELHELPPIVYQLLILSTKGCKKFILESIIQYFNNKHECGDTTIRDVLLDDMELTSSSLMIGGDDDNLATVEATVILHITFAIKQDQILGNEYLKIIKNLQNENICKIFSPFILSLTCSISSEFKFGDQIYDVLKSGLVRHYKTKTLLNNSKWLRELMPQQNFNYDYLLKSFNKSMMNCEGAVKGLIRLSFILIETNKHKPTDTSSSDLTHMETQNYVFLFGRDMLLKLAHIHSAVGEEIVKQIFNFISVSGDASLSLIYIDILSNILTEYPHIIIDNGSQQRELVDSLSFVDPLVARKLIETVIPSIKISANFRNSVILFLRKALYSKESNTRKVGVNGFLVMLIQYKKFASVLSSQSSSQLLPSSSQIQADLHYRNDIDEDNILSYEMLSIMKRCLSYNAEVKISMYRGFMCAVDKNPRLCPPIVEYLMEQLTKFYSEDANILPPLNFELCLSPEAQLLEAMPELLLSLSYSALKWKKGLSVDHKPVLVDQVENIFVSLVSRFIQCQIVDFSLEKPTDITLNLENKTKDFTLCQFVCQIYEALIQITYLSDPQDFENITKINGLFAAYKRVVVYMKERSLIEKNYSASHVYTGNFLVAVLTTIFENETLTKEIFSSELYLHFITAANAFLKRPVEKDFCEDSNKYELAKHVAKLIVDNITNGLEDVIKYNKQHLQAHLNLILTSFIIINNKPKNEARHFYVSISNNMIQKSQSSMIVDPVFQLINCFEDIVSRLLEPNSDVQNQVVVLLLQIIAKLAEILQNDSKNMMYLALWFRKIFKEKKLDDILTSKVLTRLLLSTSSCVDVSLDIHLQLAQDLHWRLGDIDPEVEEINTRQFESITKKSSSHVLLHLLTSLHSQLELVDTYINSIKLLPPTAQITMEEKEFDLFFGYISGITAVLFELIQTSISLGPCLESLMRVIIKYYATLTNLIKTKIGSSAKFDTPSKYFKKLVKQSHTQFTKTLYPMINYIQTTYTEHIRKMSGKKKTKKGATQNTTATSSVTKDSKILPNMIFSIEQYEKFLIQLEKKSKMNLLENFKLGTARDFRINLLKLNTVIEDKFTKKDVEIVENIESLEPTVKKSKLNLASKKKKVPSNP